MEYLSKILKQMEYLLKIANQMDMKATEQTIRELINENPKIAKAPRNKEEFVMEVHLYISRCMASGVRDPLHPTHTQWHAKTGGSIDAMAMLARMTVALYGTPTYIDIDEETQEVHFFQRACDNIIGNLSKKYLLALAEKKADNITGNVAMEYKKTNQGKEKKADMIKSSGVSVGKNNRKNRKKKIKYRKRKRKKKNHLAHTT